MAVLFMDSYKHIEVSRLLWEVLLLEEPLLGIIREEKEQKIQQIWNFQEIFLLIFLFFCSLLWLYMFCEYKE